MTIGSINYRNMKPTKLFSYIPIVVEALIVGGGGNTIANTSFMPGYGGYGGSVIYNATLAIPRSAVIIVGGGGNASSIDAIVADAGRIATQGPNSNTIAIAGGWAAGGTIPATSTPVANGADGPQYSISGISTYYAGGGGGFPQLFQTNRGAGGLGGGGGTSGYNGLAGTVNTGGGSGYTQYGSAANGGSGVVIIRVPDTIPIATTTGSPTITVSGGFRIYKFTASGTINF